MDYLDFICSQEFVFLSACFKCSYCPTKCFRSHHWTAQTNSKKSVRQGDAHCDCSAGARVNGKATFHKIAKLHFTSPRHELFHSNHGPLAWSKTRTIFRRMAEYNMLIWARYSRLTDEQLDACVTDVKLHMPHCGYIYLIYCGQSRNELRWYSGSHVSKDTTGLCCTKDWLSVSSPRSIMHIDTNHKLIRQACQNCWLLLFHVAVIEI